MNAKCQVRLRHEICWRAATLTDKYGCIAVESGNTVWLDGGCQCVMVFHDCPVELLDAAVEAGFWVVGGPRERKAKPR